MFDFINTLGIKNRLLNTYSYRKIINYFKTCYEALYSKRIKKKYYNDIIKRYQQNNPNVIFTFILNSHDFLKEPNFISEGWDYLCFSDNPKLTSNIWQIVPLNETDFKDFPKSFKKRSMLIMIQYYKFISRNYKIVISIGGQIKINCNLNELVKNTFNAKRLDLTICKHPIRDCIYEEAEACKYYKKDAFDIIDKQMDRYKKLNYPKHAKLYSTGIMIRKNRSRRLKKVCLVWSNELIKGSQRDQLSLNFAIWKTKNKLKVNELERSKYLERDESLPFILYNHQKITATNG